MEIFSYGFIKHALFAGLLASLACGIIGSIVISKRLSSICGGIAHAAFGGVGLGYLLSINPVFGALVFGVISSLGIGVISKKAKQNEDTSISIFWSVGMSLGIIFISLSKGYAPDLFTYLFGNILAVSQADIFSILGLDLLILLVIIFGYKEILAVCFDEEFAKVRGIAVSVLYLFLLVLVALTVVVLMKVVGTLLVIALLSLPAATASRFSRSLKTMMVISTLITAVYITCGLMLSYFFNLPSGATIIITAALFFLLSQLIPKKIR